jgi:hypothetical protein
MQGKTTQSKNVSVLGPEFVFADSLMSWFLPADTEYEDGTDSVPKLRHIKFRRRGIARRKEYNIQNTAKV